MVERIGIEPMTPCLQSRCSPSCANAPFYGGSRRTCTSDLPLIRRALYPPELPTLNRSMTCKIIITEEI